MRILATNDDGVYSPGIWAIVEAVQDIAEVIVSAPDREQSGVGTAISLSQPIRAAKVVPLINGIEAYAIEGPPADSAIVALESLIQQPVDMVISGINKGSNMGNDVLISGTMGAALQGFFRNIPSVAISVASLTEVHFSAAARVARTLAKGVLEGKLNAPMLLNVNLPNVPMSELAGVSITKLGKRTYMDVVKEGDDGRRKYYWITRDNPGWVIERGLDVWAIRHNRVSITPIHTNLTAPTIPSGLKQITSKMLEAMKAC